MQDKQIANLIKLKGAFACYVTLIPNFWRNFSVRIEF